MNHENIGTLSAKHAPRDPRHVFGLALSVGCFLFNLYLIAKEWHKPATHDVIFLLSMFGIQAFGQFFVYLEVRRMIASFLSREDGGLESVTVREQVCLALAPKISELLFLSCIGSMFLLFFVASAVGVW